LGKKQQIFALHNIKRLVFITKVESVYCAVWTESLYNTDTFRLQQVNVDERDATVTQQTASRT